MTCYGPHAELPSASRDGCFKSVIKLDNFSSDSFSGSQDKSYEICAAASQNWTANENHVAGNSCDMFQQIKTI